MTSMSPFELLNFGAITPRWGPQPFIAAQSEPVPPDLEALFGTDGFQSEAFARLFTDPWLASAALNLNLDLPGLLVALVLHELNRRDPRPSRDVGTLPRHHGRPQRAAPWTHLAGSNGGGASNGSATQPAGPAPSASAPAAPVTANVATDRAQVQTALDFALSHQGAPYVGGGSPFRFGQPGDGGTYQMAGQNAYVSPRGVVGFDCSGFVVAMYRQAGIDLAAQGIANTRSMHANLPAVGRGDLQPGDLLVKPGSHVVVFLGDVTGDGRPDVIESKPGGVAVGDASKFLDNPAYEGRRVPTG
ncbi:MAG: NlpC/P60 family protein [Deltaproteobacteria bacterium]|jgi:cell wall-associated NlpC family hydrolase